MYEQEITIMEELSEDTKKKILDNGEFLLQKYKNKKPKEV